MLGLADKTMQHRLFAALLGGKGDGVLEEVSGQYALGIEPAAMMRAQLDLVHKVTVAQISGAPDARSSEEREALNGWGKRLSAGQLHRLWQLLLKGYDEVRGAPDPLVAAQMGLLRVMHAADLPDPGGLIKQLEAFAANPPAALAAADLATSPAAVSAEWERLVSEVEQVSPLIGSSMRLAVRVVSLAPGHLRYLLAPGITGDPTADMRKGLETATGASWVIERLGESADAMPSLEEARAAERASEDAAILEDPLVRAAFAAFPGAEIIDDVPISGQKLGQKSGQLQKSWSRRA